VGYPAAIAPDASPEFLESLLGNHCISSFPRSQSVAGFGWQGDSIRCQEALALARSRQPCRRESSSSSPGLSATALALVRIADGNVAWRPSLGALFALAPGLVRMLPRSPPPDHLPPRLHPPTRARASRESALPKSP